MFKEKSLLKKIVLIDLVIVIYVILSSAIIDYRSKQMVAAVLIDQAMEWNYRYFGVHKQVVSREKRLSAGADAALSDQLKGRILMQVEQRGEIWYLSPHDSRRYYIGKARDIRLIADKFKLEVDEKDLIDYRYFDVPFPDQLKGNFVFSPDAPGLYYIDPVSAQAVSMEPLDAAWDRIKGLGLGVKDELIRKIPVGEL